MALPILSCECKTSLFFSSTGLHLCFSGSVKLPGVWLDAAALSLSQRQQHRTGRWHPDSPAALPETKLRCFAICCITHQFCLTETHARTHDLAVASVVLYTSSDRSQYSTHCSVRKTEDWNKKNICGEANRCVWSWWKQTLQKLFVLWHYQHQMAEKKLYWKGTWTFVLLPWFCFEVSDAAPAAI